VAAGRGNLLAIRNRGRRQARNNRQQPFGYRVGTEVAAIGGRDSGFPPNLIGPGLTEPADYGSAGAAGLPGGAPLREVEIDAETGALAVIRYAGVTR